MSAFRVKSNRAVSAVVCPTAGEGVVVVEEDSPTADPLNRKQECKPQDHDAW